MVMLLLACADKESAAPTPASPGVIDVRVEVPAAEEGYFDLVGPEYTIEPYTEVMYCSYITNTTGTDLIVPYVDGLQGEYGHHVVLLATDVEKPDGTTEDCSSATSMANLHAYVIADLELPAGAAVRIPGDVQFVMQSHYVNTTGTPILTRDVMRFTVVTESEVEQYAAPFAATSLGFELPPMETTDLSFDCEFPEDISMSLVGPHMHEWGTYFETLIGPTEDELETVLLVDPWRTEYRDDPPIQLFLENPKPVSAGSIVRTRCVWYNDTNEPITFPEEMCATFGYMVGTDQPMDCRIN